MSRARTGPMQSAGREVVLAEAVRTPMGKGHPEKGWYRDTHPNEMLAACYDELLARADLLGFHRHYRHDEVRRAIDVESSQLLEEPAFTDRIVFPEFLTHFFVASAIDRASLSDASELLCDSVVKST